MIELLNIDCMEYLATQPDKAFDLAIVDPPYGIGISNLSEIGYKGFNVFTPKAWDNETPQQNYFDELLRVSKNQIVWGGNYFKIYPSRCYLIWDKGEGFYGRSYAEAEIAWTSFDKNIRIFKRDPLAKGDYHGKIHPTQKPVALYDWILRNYAKPGQRILDTHLGSGSSAIAAHYFGCDFVGCEIDTEYFNAAKARFDRETRQVAMF
jgi:site-specific DNA-methyltransferase (adenine-specific)